MTIDCHASNKINIRIILFYFVLVWQSVWLSDCHTSCLFLFVSFPSFAWYDNRYDNPGLSYQLLYKGCCCFVLNHFQHSSSFQRISNSFLSIFSLLSLRTKPNLLFPCSSFYSANLIITLVIYTYKYIYKEMLLNFS